MRINKTAKRLEAAKHKAELEHTAKRNYQAERDILVAVLATLWPAHVTRAKRQSLIWSEVICIHSPAGQLAWGLPVDRLDLFRHLSREPIDCTYDGHSVSDRLARLRSLVIK
jgi:hypothetical protein